MDLDAGTYALIPFTSGCHLKPPEEVGGSEAVPLTASKGGAIELTPCCVRVLEEIFRRIDLDNNGYLSRSEFDFFQEVTSGDLCDDDAWNIILSKHTHGNKCLHVLYCMTLLYETIPYRCNTCPKCRKHSNPRGSTVYSIIWFPWRLAVPCVLHA